MKFKITLLLIVSFFNSLSQVPNKLSASEKVYGLSKFWSEVNYNFIYLDKIDRKMWDNRYKELITIVQNTKNDYEYFRELEKFCALLKDGHTNIFMPFTIKRMNSEFGDYQIFVKNFDGKAIVTRINASKKAELPIGSEIIEVNGLKTKDFLAQFVSPYIAPATDYVLEDWSVERMFTGLEGEKFDIKIKKQNGEIVSFSLEHKAVTDKELYPVLQKKELFEFKWEADDVAYFALNSFVNSKINTLFNEKLPELYKAKALIIDLRKNGGGDGIIGLNILKYLSNDSLFYSAKSTTRNHIATYKAWGKFKKVSDTLTSKDAAKYLKAYQDKLYYSFEYSADTMRVKDKKIVIPTVILLGHETASAAEDFLIYADNQKHMIKIGEKSFGSTGQPYMFDLVGGATARICTKKDTYPDGREFVGYGIKPDIEVKISLQDYLNQRDTVLEKAIEYLRKK
jgi:C-terminal processing protease CtpA/Prc